MNCTSSEQRGQGVVVEGEINNSTSVRESEGVPGDASQVVEEGVAFLEVIMWYGEEWVNSWFLKDLLGSMK